METKERKTLVGWGPDGWRCVLRRWFSDFRGTWLVDCCVYDRSNTERWHHGYSKVDFSEEAAERIAHRAHDRLA